VANFVRYDQAGDEYLARLVATQEAAGRRAPRCLVVLDDVIGRQLQFSEQVIRLFTQGRHARLAVILVSQAFTSAIAPAIRKNSDVMLFLRLRSGTEVKSVRDEVIAGALDPDDVGRIRVGGRTPDSESDLAKRLWANATREYGCLCVDWREKGVGAQQLLRTYRTPADALE
jgi:hypothetical protein